MDQQQYQQEEEYADPTLEEAQSDAPVNYDDDEGEDPLKRHTKLSWKSFGGDSFLISVIFHAVLVVFALFYVVATIQPKEPEPQEFVSGAGGGSDGDNANRQQRRMRQKPKDMSTQNKITSKSTHASLTLPEMPKMSSNTMSSMGGMKAGGASSGTGGGAGGGIGKGFGPGIGNGSAFLSAFGSAFSKTPMLKGTLYDIKRSKDGKKTFATTEPSNAGKRKNELHDALKLLVTKKFKTDELGKKYYQADLKLQSNQVYIKSQNANAATDAFANPPVSEGGKAPFAAPGWLAVYEGEITPPQTGEYRFVGMGDDVLLVGLGGEPALYAYWPREGHGPAVEYQKGWEPENHCGKGGKDGANAVNANGSYLYKGQWIKMQKGRKYKVVIAFGEGAGGLAGAMLGIQQKDVSEDDNSISVFKLSEISPELLEILKIGGRYKAAGPTFMVKKSK